MKYILLIIQIALVIFLFPACNDSTESQNTEIQSFENDIEKSSSTVPKESSTVPKESSSVKDGNSSVSSETEEEEVVAQVGSEDNLKLLPHDRDETIPFTSTDIHKAVFDTLPPKYGVFTTTDKNAINQIIKYLNNIKRLDFDETGEKGLGICIQLYLQDESMVDVSLFPSGIHVNDELHSFKDRKIYTDLEELLDSIVIQSYKDEGLLSFEGSVTKVTTTSSGYIYKIKTSSDNRIIEVNVPKTHIILLTLDSMYPMELGQNVLVFYESDTDPVIPKILIVK